MNAANAVEPGSGFDPIAWAEAECANLPPQQQARVIAFLAGIFSTYVDNPDALPLTASRWRHYVRLAVEDVTR